jgi:RimJ/RimL family protein N-acetyltransferase
MIRIREMKKEDVAMVVEWLGGTDEKFLEQWGGGRWYTYPVTLEQMEKQFETRTDNTKYFVILRDELPIGSAELDFISWETKECAVCRYLIAPQHRGRGYGTEALNVLTGYAFKNLGMKRIRLSVFDFNTSAIRCYQKAGFVETGRETQENGWVAIKMERENPYHKENQSPKTV